MYRSKTRKAKSAAAGFVKRVTSASVYSDKPKKEVPQKEKNTVVDKKEKKNAAKVKEYDKDCTKGKRDVKEKTELKCKKSSEPIIMLITSKDKNLPSTKTTEGKKTDPQVSKLCRSKKGQCSEELHSQKSKPAIDSATVLRSGEESPANQNVEKTCILSTSSVEANASDPKQNVKKEIPDGPRICENSSLKTQNIVPTLSQSVKLETGQESCTDRLNEIKSESGSTNTSTSLSVQCPRLTVSTDTSCATNTPTELYDKHPSIDVSRDHFLTLLGLVKASDLIKGQERQGPSHGLHRLTGGKLRRRVPRKSPDGVHRILSLSRGCVMPKYRKRSDSEGDSPFVTNKSKVLHVDQDRQKALSPKVQHKFKTFCAQKTPVISIHKMHCKKGENDNSADVPALGKSSSFKENEPFQHVKKRRELYKGRPSSLKLEKTRQAPKLKQGTKSPVKDHMVQAEESYDNSGIKDLGGETKPERQSLRQKIKYESVVPVWKRKQVIDFNQFRITKKDIKLKEKKERERKRKKEEELAKKNSDENLEKEIPKEVKDTTKPTVPESATQEVKKKKPMTKPLDVMLLKQTSNVNKNSTEVSSCKKIKLIEKEEDLLCHESFPEEVDDDQGFYNEDDILSLFPHSEVRSVPAILRKSRSLPGTTGEGVVIDKLSCWKYSAANVPSTNDILLSPRKARRKTPVMPKLDIADIPMKVNRDVCCTPPKLEKEVCGRDDLRNKRKFCSNETDRRSEDGGDSIDLNCHENGLEMCLDLDGAEDVDYIQEVVIDSIGKDSNSRHRSFLNENFGDDVGVNGITTSLQESRGREAAVSGLLELGTNEVDQRDSANPSHNLNVGKKVENFSFKEYECIIPHMCQVCWINDHMYCKNMKRVARDLPPCGGCLHYIPCAHYKMIQDNSNYSHRWGQNGKYVPQNIKVDEKNNLTLEPTNQGLLRDTDDAKGEEDDDKSEGQSNTKSGKRKRKTKNASNKVEVRGLVSENLCENRNSLLLLSQALQSKACTEEIQNENVIRNEESTVSLIQTTDCNNQICLQACPSDYDSLLSSAITLDIEKHEIEQKDALTLQKCEQEKDTAGQNITNIQISAEEVETVHNTKSHDNNESVDKTQMVRIVQHVQEAQFLDSLNLDDINNTLVSGAELYNSVEGECLQENAKDCEKPNNEMTVLSSSKCVTPSKESSEDKPLPLDQEIECKTSKSFSCSKHDLTLTSKSTGSSEVPVSEYEECINVPGESEPMDSVVSSLPPGKTKKSRKKRDKKLKMNSSLHSLFIRVLPASSVNSAALKGQNTGNRSKVIAIKVQHSSKRSDHVARAERGSADGEILVTVPIKPKTAKRIKEIAYMGSPEMSSLLRHMHIAVISALSADADLKNLDLLKLTKEVDTLSKTSSDSFQQGSSKVKVCRVKKSESSKSQQKDNKLQPKEEDCPTVVSLSDNERNKVDYVPNTELEKDSKNTSEAIEISLTHNAVQKEKQEAGMKFSIPSPTPEPSGDSNPSLFTFTAWDIASNNEKIINLIKSNSKLVEYLCGKLAGETKSLELQIQQIGKECLGEEIILKSERSTLNTLQSDLATLHSQLEQKKKERGQLDRTIKKLSSKRSKIEEEKSQIQKKLKTCQDSIKEIPTTENLE